MGGSFHGMLRLSAQVFNNAVAAGDAQQRREENRSIPPGTKKLGTDLGKVWENLSI